MHTRCDYLIPGIVAACRWGVESGKLAYSSTFGHGVPTYDYMSHRPNESVVYTVGGKISDKNLPQRTKFCAKIGKSVSETLALLTVAYGNTLGRN
jgi:hypothetical protein